LASGVKLPINNHKGREIPQLRARHIAARSEVVFINGVLPVRVAAPPVKGKANKELITSLSQVLGVGKDALAIIKVIPVGVRLLPLMV